MRAVVITKHGDLSVLKVEQRPEPPPPGPDPDSNVTINALEFRADGQPYAVFVDNNLGSRPEYLRSLCQALRPLGVIWSAAVTIDVTDDPSLVREMALAGCTGVFVGFEWMTLMTSCAVSR